MGELLADTDLTREQREFVDTINQSGRALMTIINDVLDFSKIEAGKMELEPHAFDLERAAYEVIRALSAKATDKGLELILDYGSNCPRYVIGDGGRLRQILFNLVGNAVKFTERGHVIVDVQCSEAHAGGVRLQVQVKDTGIGISDAERDKLFRSFSQADASTTRRYGGTGLGLAICKRLVEMMGGEIGLETSPGQGSNFWFAVSLPRAAPPAPVPKVELTGVRVLADASLGEVQSLILLTSSGQRRDARHFKEIGFAAYLTKPVLRQTLRETLAAVLGARSAAADPEEPAKSTAPNPAGTQSREDINGRILLVEDNESNRRVALSMLRKFAVSVEVAVNGQEAVDRCREPGRYDLVLMDCQMPVMDGLAATQAIRGQEQGIRMPIVALTANALEQDRRRCLDAGMDDYLSKPFSLDGLGAVLRRWLQGGGPAPTEDTRTLGADGSDTSEPTPVAVLDIAKMTELRQAMGDEDFGELVPAFLEDVERMLLELPEARARGDATEVQRLAHSVKSSTANLGLKRISSMAKALEAVAKTGDLTDTEGPLSLIEDEFRAARKALLETLGDLAPKTNGVRS